MNDSRARIAIALLVLAALLGMLWPAATSKVPAATSKVPTPAASPAPAPTAATPPAPAAPPRQARRVQVPRPAKPAAAGSPSPPAAPRPGAPSATLNDRRADPPADAPAVRELLMQQMEEASEAVKPCVDRWAEADPQLSGTLKMTLMLDADGLSDAWIEDHETLPPGLLDCFSDSVFASDWAGISREPLQVTWPFTVRAEAP